MFGTSFQRIRRTTTALALASAATIGAVVAAPTASASVPQCTKYGSWTAPAGWTIFMPTTSSNSNSCFLAQGDVSGAVQSLQEALVGCNGQNIAIDGDFGPATFAAVKAVQKKYGLTQDGVYGSNTRDKMYWPDHGINGHCWRTNGQLGS